jgi:hypothetical protein
MPRLAAVLSCRVPRYGQGEAASVLKKSLNPERMGLLPQAPRSPSASRPAAALPKTMAGRAIAA